VEELAPGLVSRTPPDQTTSDFGQTLEQRR